ncbi:acyltransferase [Paenibacillus sp. SYP-B3998]|uniref:Acyltransferase n=1 Tax=Paenibacillus sp. SYP-B3998 TaxID=2678564 RepID=A0A6G3ZYD0_9BACL|nr:acyltransferase [Paenibacillus sp. SYP-B3998]NEW07100.1 acyltransferase [Paenibacillus sp. SYP-B3998]
MHTNQKTALQASRGVAACLVLLFHTSSMSFKYYQYDLFGISSLPRSGGLDYFFVLTGFLLYRTYGKKIGSSMNALPFLTNRLIRIFPLYWLITLIVLPVYFLVPSFGYGFETHKDTIIRSLLLLPQAHGPIIPVAWSLSYFVLFYLLFSLIMAMRKEAAYSFAALWIVLTVCNVFHVPMIGPDIERHFYLNFLFSEVNLEFVVGCLLAKWTEHRRNKHYKLLMICGAIGFVLIWLNNKFSVVSYHDYLLYTIPAALVLLGASSVPTEPLRLPLWVQGLEKLGNASYTTLLTHLLFISILMKLSKASHISEKIGFLWTDLLIVAMTIPLCYMAYILAEKPLVAYIKSAIKLPTAKSPRPVS